jgi:peptidyl-Asp metalloendopeptidase
MKLRVGACALILVLAGCAKEGPDAGLAGMQGVASSSPAKGKMPSALPLSRAIGASIANAPDRGALLSYTNHGAPLKQEGAYTWYPISMSEAHAFKGVATGELVVPSPTGGDVKLRYERHVEEIDGNWTWIGRVEGGDPMQEAIITFGEKAVFGSIPQPNGKPALSLQTRGGALFAVQTDPSKVVSATKGHIDMMVPEAAALRASMGAAASQAAPVSQAATAVSQAAPPTAANTVDVAVGYTPEFATANGGASGANTRLVYLVQVGNQAFTNSDINGYLRIVHTLQVSYTNTNTNQTALSELTGSNGQSAVTVPASLAPLRTARDQYGADIAVLVRKFNTPENEGCGIAWLNGAGQTAITSADAAWGFAVISDGFDQGTDGKTYYCADETLVHEAAHLMGSAHDRDNSRTSAGALQYGRFAYSFGYKTSAAAGNFYTIMAYGDTGQTAHRIFSTPLKSTCGGSGNLPCGVANSEDNARSLNQTIPVVAAFRATAVPFAGAAKADMNGDSKSDIVWWNSTSGVLAYWAMNGATYVSGFNQGIGTAYQPSTIGRSTSGARYDILMRRPSDRTLFSYRSGETAFTPATIGQYGDGWVVVGQGDINGDGLDDLLWRHPQQGHFAYWLMNGAVYQGGQTYSPPASFEIVAIADFNGDGRVDLVFSDPASRSTSLWASTGNGFTVTQIGQYGADWKIIGAADVTGDGKADLLLRNTAKTYLAYWKMDGAVYQSSYAVPTPTTFELGTTGDYNGDGIGDLLWIDSSDRSVVMWLGNGLNFGNYVIGRIGPEWALQK